MPRKLPANLWPPRCSDRIRERAEMIAIKAEEETEALKAAALIKAKEEAEALAAAAGTKSESIDAIPFNVRLLADGAKLEPTGRLSQRSQAKYGRLSGRKTRRERAKNRVLDLPSLPRGVNQAASILKQRSAEVKRAIAEAVARSHHLGPEKATTVAADKPASKGHIEAIRERSRSRFHSSQNCGWATPPGDGISSSPPSKVRSEPTQGFLGPDDGELLVATGTIWYSPQDPQWIRALLRGWLYSFFETKGPSLNPLAAVIHGMPRPGEIIRGIAFPNRYVRHHTYDGSGDAPWGGIRLLWSIPVRDRYTKGISAIVRTDQVACWLRIRVSELLGFLALAHPLEWLELQEYLAFRLRMTFTLKEVPELRACFESTADSEVGASNNLQQLPARARHIACHFIKMDHEHRKLLAENLYTLVVNRRRGQLSMLEAHERFKNLRPWPPVQEYQPPQEPQTPYQGFSFPPPFLSTPPSSLPAPPSSHSSSACPSPLYDESEAPPTAKWWCLSPSLDLTEYQHQVEFLAQLHDQFFEDNAQNFTLLGGSFNVWDPEMSTDPTIYLDRARILDRLMHQYDRQHHAIAEKSAARSGHWPDWLQRVVVRQVSSSFTAAPSRPNASGSDGDVDERILQARQRDAVNYPTSPRSD